MASITVNYDGDGWFVDSADGAAATVDYSIDTAVERRVVLKVRPIEPEDTDE